MIPRTPRGYAACCGVANAFMGAYVVATLGYMCVTQGWPDQLWGSLAIFGLLLGGASLGLAGGFTTWRARNRGAVSRALGLTALLGTPAGLGSGAIYVFMLHSLVTRGNLLGRPPDAEFYVLLVAFLSPLPISLATACIWLLFRGRLDDMPAPDALHG